jgi:hypothetical protein
MTFSPTYTIVVEMVENPDSPTPPQHAEAGKHTLPSTLYNVMYCMLIFTPFPFFYLHDITDYMCTYEFPGGSEDGQRARFHIPSHDYKCGFGVSNLVQARLEGRPWWPGEIFNPSHASELALKHQKKGTHFVAFFGDASFVWCDES